MSFVGSGRCSLLSSILRPNSFAAICCQTRSCLRWSLDAQIGLAMPLLAQLAQQALERVPGHIEALRFLAAKT